jgi:hypothetical protein
MLRLNYIPFLLVFVTNISAYEMPKVCDKKSNDCASCSITPQDKLSSLEKLTTKISGPIARYELFAKKANDLKNSNVVLKNKLASMFRSLRDGEKEPTYKNGMVEVNKVEEDFKKLTVLAKESTILEKKFNICVTNCSPVRRQELLADIKKIQNLKVALLVGQPILASSHFESIFRDNLKEALFDNLQIIVKKDLEFSRFESDFKRPIFNNNTPAQIDEYNNNLISRFPLISDGIVKELSTREIGTEEANACFFAKSFHQYTKKEEYKELALDVGLFALPFALGPVGRMGGFAIESFFGSRLATWGLGSKELTTALRVSDIAFQGALLSHEANAIYNKANECQKIEADLIEKADQSKLKMLDQCKSDLSNRILTAEISSISLAASSLGPRIFQTFSKVLPTEIKAPKVISLISKDFGGGKNKMIKTEIDAMMKATAKEKAAFAHLSNDPKFTKKELSAFLKKEKIDINPKSPAILEGEKLAAYKKEVTKDTVEMLYIPGSEIPFLPNAVNKVGHVAIRIGDKVYHQTGGSGFKIESFDDFLNKTKKNYKVFGTVLESSEKERKVMESYFQKMHDKQLPYSFLVNNCAQAVCKAMKLADFENVRAPMNFDPILSTIAATRSERVMMKTMYNADKDMTVEELKKATFNNRLAFYGIPGAAAGAATVGTYEAADFLIEYLDQAKDVK